MADLVRLDAIKNQIEIPLPLALGEWLHLRSHLRVYSVSANRRKNLWRVKPSYMIPLTGNITLCYERETGDFFSIQVAQGMILPFAVQRNSYVLGHKRQCVEVGWLLETTAQQVMAFSTELRLFFIRQLLAAQDHLEQQLLVIHPTGATKRLIALLLFLDREFAPGPICCTHQTLALLANLQRETVTLLLGALKQQALIELYRKEIELIDRPQLEQLAATF